MRYNLCGICSISTVECVFVYIQILRSRCHNEDDYSYEEVDEQKANVLLKPFCPSEEPDAPQLAMTSAIRLVNRLLLYPLQCFG